MNRAEVNASLPTIDIKGKQYVTVDSRVDAFWQLYPNGAIVTELVSDDGSRCVMKASVYSTFDEQKPIATGHAFEVQSSSYINKTSYLENCETSAVGRALGFLGIGSNGSIASADEVSAAIQQQEVQKAVQKKTSPQKASQQTGSHVAELEKEAIALGISKKGIRGWIAAHVGEDMSTFTDEQIKRVEKYIEQLIADKKSLNG